jgi:hypothetical protein
MRAIVVGLVIALWVIAAGLLVATSNKPNRFAVTSGDLKYDFISAYWIAEGRPAEALDRATADKLGDQLGTPRGSDWWEGAPAQTHPPPTALLIRPLVPLGFRLAAIAWLVFSLLLLGILAGLLLAIWQRSDRLPPLTRSWPLAIALALWPPSLFNLINGQWSILLATLVAAGWWRYEHGRRRQAAGWLAAAVAVKLTPAILGPYLLRRNRRLALEMVAALAAIVAVTLPVTGGIGAWRQFIHDARIATPIFEAWVHNTASVRGIFVRLFVPSPFVTPVAALPSLGHALALASSIALVVIAAAVTWRRASEPDAAGFAVWSSLIPLLNPLSWTHNVLVLLLPAALLARAPAGRRQRRIVAGAVALLTVPYEALWQLAGHRFPLPASRSWLLGLHAVAGLVLFATACRASIVIASGERRLRLREPIAGGAGPSQGPESVKERLEDHRQEKAEHEPA